MVMSYPLTETQIEQWSETIARLRPEATTEQISWVIDRFLSGVWEFDKDLGIANIIRGLEWSPR